MAERYRVVEVVGRGSFGRVLKVLDTQAQGAPEARALKVVPPGPHEAMLVDEFEQLAKLRHPSLPKVHEVGRLRAPIIADGIELATGSPFFVADWIAGVRSDAVTWQGALGAPVWALLADLAGALATIHAGGLVHGDVAPQNVLIASEDRAVLVDLGLSSGSGARGTPAYMAPEALAGHVEPRSDLYGLGATLIRIITGRPLFEGATLGELAQRILGGAAPRPLPGVPAPLADLIHRLVARDADARPASALAVLDELDQLAPAIAPGSARRARPKVGPPPAPGTWAGAAPVVEAVERALAGDGVAVIAVAGPAATGGRQLADTAMRRWQLAQVARQRSGTVIAGPLDDVAAQLGVAAVSSSAASWLERTARAARRAPELVLIELGDDPRTADLIAALVRAPGDRPVIVLTDRAPASRAGVAIQSAPLLDEDGIAALASQMLGAAPPRAWAQGLRAASGGLPLTAIELVRSLAGEKDPLAIDWSARTSAGATELRGQKLRALAAGPRRIAASIAAWGGRARIDRVLATARAEGGKVLPGLADLAELERAGLARRHGDEIAIERATLEAIESLAGAAALASLATSALSALEGGAAGGLAGGVDAAGSAAESSRGAPDAGARGGAARGLAGDRDGVHGARGAGNVRDASLMPATDSGGARGDATGGGLAGSRGASANREDAGLGSTGVAAGNRAAESSPLWLAPLLERAPLDAARGERACEVAEQLLARGRAEQALALARRAIAALPARAGLLAARAAAAAGAHKDAIALARAAAVAGAEPVAAELVIARAAQRAGDLDAAEATLAAIYKAHPDHAEAAGTYARLLVTRSRYEDARTIAKAGPLVGLRAEAAGLAAFYLGELDEADAAFAALELGASTAGETAAVGRAMSLRGMVAQQRGQLGLASDRYREAARRLGEVGELHAAAVAELNLGTVLAERGRASEALPRLAAAGRVFADLGATTELCAAELNRGNALLAVGQIDDARLAAEAALSRADGAPHLRAFALLVLGDARRRLGDEGGAVRSYREALAIAVDRADMHAQISAHIALAEAGHRDSEGLDIEALCASTDDRDRWTLARGRLALTESALPAETARSLASACVEVAARATEADRLERSFRAHAVAAALAQRARDPALAAAQTQRARAAHAAIAAATAPAFRASLEQDPDLARLPGGATKSERQRASDRGAPDHGHLRRLLTLSRRLNSEASVERILDDVIDTAIELTSAERGFLLLRQADGELAAVVARNFSAGDLAGSGPATVSRSIAERAAQTGEAVVTVDAGIDERFGAAASVAALRLRSVLAVPLRQRGAITGCIYVDHRLRGGAFDESAAGVLGELADIAAIAIENARLTDDLRRTTRAVDELNGRLSSELADRDAELVRVKADLPDRDRLRNRYEKIVGRSPAVVKMLDVIDRAASTSLPVVIAGESGTGKELVARALHDAGPRKAGAFVAINCSAVPEPLLESELFGHVRGAFTGADRDRRGLFEVADGGTLFLDEIADTSPGMQAKLLRVLQDGVIRRVGDTATQKVDVRVIAASQHTLAELAAAGRFREDLRFRIEVISILVPPLRERDGDIPLLVDHLLAALRTTGPAPRLTRNALRALAQHRWPGNVRELENALARGLAMGGDVIDIGDLPEAIASAAARPEPSKPAVGDDLRLKPALSATEQAYITAAMGRAKNNQTVAARLLGLSRFGLQKKLRRIAGDDDTEDED